MYKVLNPRKACLFAGPLSYCLVYAANCVKGEATLRKVFEAGYRIERVYVAKPEKERKVI